MAASPFATLDRTSTDTAEDAYPVTPADGADLPEPVRGLRVAGAGNVVVVTWRGNTRTLPFLAGETRLIKVLRVKSTNTTATGIEGIV